MQLLMTKQLALDKGGLHSGTEKRIDAFKPNERKRYYCDIFPKTRTRKGEQPLQIKILEHFEDYNYIKGKQVKNLELFVDE